MKKYVIRFDGDNIHITRNFPEIGRTISRCVLNCSEWMSLVRWAKRDILKEAKEVWSFSMKGGKNDKI